MGIQRLIVKGGMGLGAGQAVAQFSSFVKSVILARLLSPADFGIASIFALALSLLEMTSNLSLNTFIVQSKHGDDEAFQRTAHFLQVYRGAVAAILLFLLGGQIALLFGISEASWAFRLIALVPLIRAFNHLDLDRLQRGLRYGPSVTASVVSSISGTIAAAVLGFWLRNYSAMLGVILVQAAVFACASQLLAERPFRCLWKREYARQMLRFGWPLLINGFLMYCIFEGDRIAIGTANRIFHSTFYTLTDLGIYSVAFSLTMVTAMPIGTISTSLFLPLLSGAQDSPVKFERLFRLCMVSLCSFAAANAIVFIIGGGWIIQRIYGLKYSNAVEFIGWLSAMWAVRVIRAAPTMAAIARGDTKNGMISNIVRNLSFISTLLAISIGGKLVWIAINGFLGEVAALITCLWYLNKKHSVSAVPYLKAPALVALGIIAAFALMAGGLGRFGFAGLIWGIAPLVLLVVLGMPALFPWYRMELMAFAAKFSHAGIKQSETE
jgi:O-antigen/teichoic acid export membrane protein